MKETVVNTDGTQEITVNIRIASTSGQKITSVSIKSDATLRDLLLKAGFRRSPKFFINSKGYLDLEYLDKKLCELGVENGRQLNIYKKYQNNGCASFFIRPEAPGIQPDKKHNQVDGDDDVAQDGFVFKLDPIYNKIDKFSGILKKMEGMKIFPKWVVTVEERLKLVKGLNLCVDLNQKNEFTDDQDVYNKTKDYYESQSVIFLMLTGQRFIKDPPSFDKYQSKFKEMTTREFLKLFIKDLANKAEWYRPDIPKWKYILYFVGIFLGTHWFFYNSNEYPRLNCFFGALNIFAYAGLICYLVFNLSLAVLIPSVIVLGLLLFVNLISVFDYRKSLYDEREEYGENVKQFFDLVGEINQYLDTFDLPQEKISSGEKIPRESSIDEKIQDANTKKDDKEGSDIKTKKSNDEKDGK